MPSPYDKIKEAVAQITAKYKVLTGDGKLSWQDTLSLLAVIVATITKLVQDTFGGTSIAEKRELILTIVGEIYDEIIAPIDISGIPNIIEPIVDKMLRRMLLNFAEAWTDAAIEMLTRDDQVTPLPGGDDPKPFKPVPFTPYMPMYAQTG